MKHAFTLAAIAFACSAAMAQAPAGQTARPPQEANAAASGGAPAAKAEMKTNAKTMGNKGMDLNGDGMISRKEWDAYHGGMWKGMKANKQGMVPWAEVEARMKGGPN